MPTNSYTRTLNMHFIFLDSSCVKRTLSPFGFNTTVDDYTTTSFPTFKTKIHSKEDAKPENNSISTEKHKERIGYYFACL